MIINLPHIKPIDTLNLSEDFEEQVKESFRVFTELTNRDYTYQDKLTYLDNLREYLHPKRAEECVKELIWERTEHEIVEYDNFPDKEDFWCFDFMVDCFKEGQSKEYRGYYEKYSSSKNDRTLKVILRIIQIIVNWEEYK